MKNGRTLKNHMDRTKRMAVGKTIKVIGVDPALRNFGFAVATVDVENDKIISIDDLKLVKTEDDAGKKVRRNSDDLRRAREHVKALQMFSDPKNGTALAFVEVPVGSQSARAMASYGVCIGVLASCKCGMVEVTPTEVKVRATGQKTATKNEMIDWATELYPDAPWLTRTSKGEKVLKNENEHLADAVGAINAGLQTQQWAQIKAAYSILSP